MHGARPGSIDDVLVEERDALRPDGSAPQPLSALCISGGGIRSATFALGAIQGLADHSILGQFDYLSTVSGGGYIGGWLTAWKHRVHGIENVIPHLRRNAPPAEDGQPDPIQHLREYNNYLSPKLGGLSADTWTLASTVMRNVMLNWLVLIPLLMAALMAPRLLVSVAAYGDLANELHGSAMSLSQTAVVVWVLPALAATLFTLSMFNILRYLPAVGRQDHTGTDFAKYVMGPLIAAVLLFAGYDSLYFYTPDRQTTHMLRVALWMLAPSFVAWMLYLTVCGKSAKERWRLLTGPLSLAIAMLGVGTGIGAWLVTDLVVTDLTWSQYVTVGPPLLLFAFGLSGSLFIGLTSMALQDEDREWLARAAAHLLLFCAVWLAGCAVVLLAPGWAFTWAVWGKSALAAVGTVSAFISSFGGYFGSETTSGSKPPKSAKAMIAMKVAPALFVTLLAVGLAILTNLLLATTAKLPRDWWDHEQLLTHSWWWEIALWTAGFSALSWLMARYININKFSLNAMYRDRLVRAYLGASNPSRRANKFTGFAKNDNIHMHNLDSSMKPFHVLNLTLNLVGGDRLAWQQRKAESFTVSPLHCGNLRLGYRPATGYGGPDGISLGTAMTISGAAASPSMGYHSSALVGFIMTLFNVRLGAWLGNPGKAGADTWKYAGPRSAVASLAREAFGLTTDRSQYVYLSDGGHFENLGLYEMVLRRCRTIVVLDSGCDPDFTYEDLGNALRKIRIDLKIPVVFEDAGSAPLREKKRRCSTARIQYSAVDGNCEDGELLYIKPMMLGNEPPDVASYASAHAAFPHESTAEQWFDESQTESYRMLGLHTVDEIFGKWVAGEPLERLVPHVEKVYLPDGMAARAALA